MVFLEEKSKKKKKKGYTSRSSSDGGRRRHLWLVSVATVLRKQGRGTDSFVPLEWTRLKRPLGRHLVVLRDAGDSQDP